MTTSMHEVTISCSCGAAMTYSSTFIHAVDIKQREFEWSHRACRSVPA